MPSIEAIAAIIAFIGFGGMVTLAGFIWKLADRLRALEGDAATAKAKADHANDRAERLQTDLSDFKVEAARRFVTDEMLIKVEERIITSIDRLSDRLDRIIEGRPAARREGAR